MPSWPRSRSAGSAAAAAYAAAAPQQRDAAVAKAIAHPARSEANRARDAWRHPAQTLAFFGVTPAKKVVEFVPGGGWYTEILARVPANGQLHRARPLREGRRCRAQAAGGQGAHRHRRDRGRRHRHLDRARRTARTSSSPSATSTTSP
ncbi:hypothetical protein AB5I41_25590 [Sphingomonas sp. MMS24-JH45]